MKNFKKIISFMLVAFFTMFTFAPSAFASEVDGVTSQVIEDNEYQRIVTAADETGKYTATYNKLTGNLIVVDDNGEKIVDVYSNISVENDNTIHYLSDDGGIGGLGVISAATVNAIPYYKATVSANHNYIDAR